MISLPSLITLAAGGGDPMGHVKPYYPFFDPIEVGPFVLGLELSTITLILFTALFVWFMFWVAKSIELGPESEGNRRYVTKGHFASMIEVVIVYLRDKVIEPQLGSETRRFLPLLLTLFFFILFYNLLGLVPLIDLQYLITGTAQLGSEDPKVTKFLGGTATGRLGVTAALAITAFLVWNWHGIRQNGFGGWLYHFTGNTPWPLWIIMIPVEIMGAIVKPAALSIRLFANMTAGHILLAVLIIFIAAAPKAIGVAGAPISIVAFVGAVAIFFLEVFVALLQAFIFTFLTTVFISQMSHHGDHGEHADHTGREPGHAPAPAAA